MRKKKKGLSELEQWFFGELRDAEALPCVGESYVYGQSLQVKEPRHLFISQAMASSADMGLLDGQALIPLATNLVAEHKKGEILFELLMTFGKFRLQVAMVLQRVLDQLFREHYFLGEWHDVEAMLGTVPRWLLTRWVAHQNVMNCPIIPGSAALHAVMPENVLLGINRPEIENALAYSPKKNYPFELRRPYVISQQILRSRRQEWILEELLENLAKSVHASLNAKYPDCQTWAHEEGRKSNFRFLLPFGGTDWKRFAPTTEESVLSKELRLEAQAAEDENEQHLSLPLKGATEPS